MRRTILLLFLTVESSCSKDDLALNRNHVRARVMLSSCGGTVLQFIDATPARGKDWLWFKNLNGPFDAANPAQTYPRCITAFKVPKVRQIVGDTLDFTYDQITNPPGPICTIGGLPTVYISIDNLKSR
jgi:hypothetical protein